MSINLSQRIKLKKFVSKLKKFSGRHTEFISVYVPPKAELFKTIQQLEFEQGTATNIKDKNNSKAVIQSLERMIRTLRVIEKTPEKGLAIFSGNVSEKENVDNYEVFHIEPPSDVNLKLYRCDKKFNLEPLEKMCSDDSSYGLIVMDKGEACVGILVGTDIKVIKSMNSNVPGKHKSGGQSAQRFARIREGAAVEFYKRIADVVISEFTFNKNLKGILIGGPGTTKNNFFDGNYLNEEIKGKVLMPLFDITYTNDFGLKELIGVSEEVLKDSALSRQKKVIRQFLTNLNFKPNMCSYGLNDVEKALDMAAVDTLIVVEEKISDEKLEELSNKCELIKASFEIVSNKTSEGAQMEGLSGFGAILRYPIE